MHKMPDYMKFWKNYRLKYKKLIKMYLNEKKKLTSS